MKATGLVAAAALFALAVGPRALAATAAGDDPVLWPERERRFWLDGPALLLAADARQSLLAATPAERARRIEAFLARDPLPDTPANELVEGIGRRRARVEDEFVSWSDERARVMFLNGAPESRRVIECGATFEPLEIWTYGERQLVFYRPGQDRPFILWLPIDSKHALYISEMEYWLEQWEELRRRVGFRARRFDIEACPDAPAVDQATGVSGLSGFQAGRPTTAELSRYLEPPADLAAWARAAAAEPPPDGGLLLAVGGLELAFPEVRGQRTVTRMQVTLPVDAGLGVREDPESGEREHRLTVAGVVEQSGKFFEEFRVRFKLPPLAEPVPIALVVERALRPDRSYMVRLEVVDETSGARARLIEGFAVPREAEPLPELPVPEAVIVAIDAERAERALAGADHLILVPPVDEVILGTWRAETLVSGEAIRRVVFKVDGEEQLVRTRRPFTAEVRLAEFPREQVVRAEGYDASGALVSADQVVLNQPRGIFRVKIAEPFRGAPVRGRFEAVVEVVVPDGRRVASLELVVDERTVATLERPPWRVELDAPPADGVSYLTAIAVLDDGSRAEDVRFLNAPGYLEEVEVDLVEVLATVVDGGGSPVPDLERTDFEVYEDGRRQRIERFERVENLPLSIGLAIDSSGSMATGLYEAQKAAREFLTRIVTPRDRAFALAFAGEPVLLIPPTDDVGAVEASMADLRSIGWTAMHDAIVTSLYYLRAAEGRRALILLSDGDDSSSHYAFRDALEYARRSGVVVYTVGIGTSGWKGLTRKKLVRLATDTGGRAFFIQQANELDEVYEEIEHELRSQYLITYATDGSGPSDVFREIEVRVRNGRLKARTQRGYYPS